MIEQTFDDVLASHIRPMGKWQWRIFTLVSICSCFPFIFMGTLAHDPPPHRCYIPYLDDGYGNFSKSQIRQIAIPRKKINEPPMIGQNYHPCEQYVLPYKMLAKGSFQDAVKYREKLEHEDHSKMLKSTCKNGYFYDHGKAVYKYSMGEEFSLVCEKAGMLTFTTSIYMAGMTAGLLVAGFVADWIGRKPALLIFGFSHLVVAYSISLSKSASIYAIMRFLLAWTANAHGIVAFVLCMEITDDQHRSLLNTLLVIYYSFFARGVFTLMAYLIQQWRHLTIAMATSLLLVFLYPTPLVTESPRWLLSRGRIDEANALIRRAVKINRGKTYFQNMLKANPVAFDCSSRSKNTDYRTNTSWLVRVRTLLSSLSVLFLSPKVRFRFLVGMVLFCCQVIIFYGLSFYAIHVKGNPYLISFVEGVVAIPAAFILYFLYKWYNRRGPMMALHGISGITCLTSAIILLVKGSGSTIVVVLANIVICFEEATFNMLYVFLPEVFPTEIRNTGFSSASAIARTAGMISSYIEGLDKTAWLPLPMLIFGGVAVMLIVCTYLLPETKGCPLLDTIAELEGHTNIKDSGNDLNSLLADGDDTVGMI